MTIVKKPFSAYTGNEPYIFVSYAHKDDALVYPIINKINNDGYRVWYDEGISIGHDWTSDIGQALHNCSQFVVFITNNSVSSRQVGYEIKFAINNNKPTPIAAIHLSNTDLPNDLYQLASFQALMKYEISETDFYKKLYSSFSSILKMEENESNYIEDVQTEHYKYNDLKWIYCVYGQKNSSIVNILSEKLFKIWKANKLEEKEKTLYNQLNNADIDFFSKSANQLLVLLDIVDLMLINRDYAPAEIKYATLKESFLNNSNTIMSIVNSITINKHLSRALANNITNTEKELLKNQIKQHDIFSISSEYIKYNIKYESAKKSYSELSEYQKITILVDFISELFKDTGLTITEKDGIDCNFYTRKEIVLYANILAASINAKYSGIENKNDYLNSFKKLDEIMKNKYLSQAKRMLLILQKANVRLDRMNDNAISINELIEALELNIETLAAIEHNEWVKSMKSSGFLNAEIIDYDFHLHNELVDYSELSEEGKNKARIIIRTIPEIIIDVGLSIKKIE